MSIICNFPGGDSTLTVIGCANAASLPASADTGTVAVITSAAPGKAYGSAHAPAGPAEGDVWILTGAASVVPIALTDEITLYPQLVYQSMNAAWVLREGYVYSGSAWVSLSTHLYDHGDFILASDISVVSVSNGALGKNADNVVLLCSRGEGVDAYCVAGFDTPIDVTNIATIKAFINHSDSTSGGGAYLGVSLNKSAAMQASVYSTSAGWITLSLDVSALTGAYYVMLGVYDQGDWYTTEAIYTYEVYYER